MYLILSKFTSEKHSLKIQREVFRRWKYFHGEIVSRITQCTTNTLNNVIQTVLTQIKTNSAHWYPETFSFPGTVIHGKTIFTTSKSQLSDKILIWPIITLTSKKHTSCQLTYGYVPHVAISHTHAPNRRHCSPRQELITSGNFT